MMKLDPLSRVTELPIHAYIAIQCLAAMIEHGPVPDKQAAIGAALTYADLFIKEYNGY